MWASLSTTSPGVQFDAAAPQAYGEQHLRCPDKTVRGGNAFLAFAQRPELLAAARSSAPLQPPAPHFSHHQSTGSSVYGSPPMLTTLHEEDIDCDDMCHALNTFSVSADCWDGRQPQQQPR